MKKIKVIIPDEIYTQIGDNKKLHEQIGKAVMYALEHGWKAVTVSYAYTPITCPNCGSVDTRKLPTIRGSTVNRYGCMNVDCLTKWLSQEEPVPLSRQSKQVHVPHWDAQPEDFSGEKPEG